MIKENQKIFRLTGKVQHYDWGGYEFIPRLLGISNTGKQPFAEYWMGTHPKGPSEILIGDQVRLLSDFTQLSYLLKVQDVKEMLSIQVHPEKKAAEIEYARENREHIPLDAPERNYRDDNHKPELIAALGEFWLLHGFKEEDALAKLMKTIPEFQDLFEIFNRDGYEKLYETIMEMPQESVNELLQPLLNRIQPVFLAGLLKKHDENYWAAKAGLKFTKDGMIDRGIFSIYLFNLVKLKKGEAVFQPTGLPHAYLEGQGIEIMSNSDNVLRGGLTTKHVDVKELIKHVRCEPVIPGIMKGVGKKSEKLFPTTAPDFELSYFNLTPPESAVFTPLTVEILFLLSGEVECKAGNSVIRQKQGQAVAIFPGEAVFIKAIQSAELYRASVPNTAQ